MHGHPHHHLNYKRNRRISSFPTSFEGLSNMSLMDNHCTHVSLGHLECHWKYFNREMDKTHQLLLFLSHHPAAPTHLLSPLQVELDTINDMYMILCKPTIISAINLLNTDPSFDRHIHSNSHHRRSLQKMSIVISNV